MSLSLISVPVFRDTTKTAGQLYIQWARTYHYGHLLLPCLSVSTFLLYQYTAWSKKRAGSLKQWRSLLVAGIVTVLMVPFTWVFMTPTNNKLFALEEMAQINANSVGSLREAQDLVLKWSMLHMTRSMFPLVGAIMGSVVLLGRALF